VKKKPQRLAAGAFSVGAESARRRRKRSGKPGFRSYLRKALRTAGQMIYGATVWEMVREVEKQRGQREKLFILLVFGDLLGVPVLPSFYTLRLLPYVSLSFDGWRMSLSRPRDLTDLCNQEFS